MPFSASSPCSELSRVGVRGGVDHAAEAAPVGLDAGHENTLYAHREVALQRQFFEQHGIVEPVEVVELVDQELLCAALVSRRR